MLFPSEFSNVVLNKFTSLFLRLAFSMYSTWVSPNTSFTNLSESCWFNFSAKRVYGANKFFNDVEPASSSKGTLVSQSATESKTFFLNDSANDFTVSLFSNTSCVCVYTLYASDCCVVWHIRFGKILHSYLSIII